MPIYSFVGTGIFQLVFSHALKNPKGLTFMHVGNTFSIWLGKEGRKKIRVGFKYVPLVQYIY